MEKYEFTATTSKSDIIIEFAFPALLMFPITRYKPGTILSWTKQFYQRESGNPICNGRNLLSGRLCPNQKNTAKPDSARVEN